MAIRKRKGRASAYEVYWINPFTKKRESVSCVSLSDARKEESLVKHRLKHEKESFRPDDFEENTGGTVREIIALYLAGKKFSGKNLTTTLEHLKPVVEAFGRREVASLEKKDLVKFINDASIKGIKTTTSHRRLTILRAALAWASESELIDSNPLVGIKLPQGKYEKITPPSPAETTAILSVAPPHLYRAIMLGVSFGMRIGPTELFRIRWEDVDLERGMLRVWSADKNLDRPSRDVPIKASLLGEMKEWRHQDKLAGQEYLIAYKGKPISSIKKTWHNSLKRAGINRRIRPYDLRHAFATYALDAGADINAVADIMGHANVTMILKHYQHTKEAARRSTVESLPDFPKMRPTDEANEKRD